MWAHSASEMRSNLCRKCSFYFQESLAKFNISLYTCVYLFFYLLNLFVASLPKLHLAAHIGPNGSCTLLLLTAAKINYPQLGSMRVSGKFPPANLDTSCSSGSAVDRTVDEQHLDIWLIYDT